MTCTATIIAPKAVVPHGTVGELGPNIEAKIVDLDGNEVPDGERGEFWLRGPNMMKGWVSFVVRFAVHQLIKSEQILAKTWTDQGDHHARRLVEDGRCGFQGQGRVSVCCGSHQGGCRFESFFSRLQQQEY